MATAMGELTPTARRGRRLTRRSGSVRPRHPAVFRRLREPDAQGVHQALLLGGDRARAGAAAAASGAGAARESDGPSAAAAVGGGPLGAHTGFGVRNALGDVCVLPARRVQLPGVACVRHIPRVPPRGGVDVDGVFAHDASGQWLWLDQPVSDGVWLRCSPLAQAAVAAASLRSPKGWINVAALFPSHRAYTMRLYAFMATRVLAAAVGLAFIVPLAPSPLDAVMLVAMAA